MVAYNNSVTPPTSTTTRYYAACPERSRGDDQRVLLETDATASETDLRYFVYGNYIDEVLVMHRVSPSADFYYGHDHLYSPVVVFGYLGGLQAGERYEYDAYGQVTIMDGSYTPRSASNIGNPYTFTGRRLDVLDGGNLTLMDYRRRTYDTHTGRFMQQDPLGHVDTMNLYEYAKSSPLFYADPSGLLTWNDCCPKLLCMIAKDLNRLAKTGEIVEDALEVNYELKNTDIENAIRVFSLINGDNIDIGFWEVVWGDGSAGQVVAGTSMMAVSTPKFSRMWTNYVMRLQGQPGFTPLPPCLKPLMNAGVRVGVYGAIFSWGVNMYGTVGDIYSTARNLEILLDLSKTQERVIQKGYQYLNFAGTTYTGFSRGLAELNNKPWTTGDEARCQSDTLLHEATRRILYRNIEAAEQWAVGSTSNAYEIQAKVAELLGLYDQY